MVGCTAGQLCGGGDGAGDVRPGSLLGDPAARQRKHRQPGRHCVHSRQHCTHERDGQRRHVLPVGLRLACHCRHRADGYRSHVRWSSSGYVCAVGGMQQQHPTSHRAWAACLRGQGTGLMKIVLVFLGVAADGQPPLPQWSLKTRQFLQRLRPQDSLRGRDEVASCVSFKPSKDPHGFSFKLLFTQSRVAPHRLLQRWPCDELIARQHGCTPLLSVPSH